MFILIKMVKNAGGCRQKKQARKHLLQNNNNKKTRMLEEDGEIYGMVTKMFGGENCSIIGLDGKERMCIIRKKFRGRHKRYNRIENGTWILAGVRDWESGDKEKCDLLEVYNDADKETLKKSYDDKYFMKFIAMNNGRGGDKNKHDNDEYIFQFDNNDPDVGDVFNSNTLENKSSEEEKTNSDKEEFDWDAI
jgi:initiation factor 1A